MWYKLKIHDDHASACDFDVGRSLDFCRSTRRVMVGGKKRTRKSVKMENDVLRSAHSCVALCIMFLYSQRLVGFRMFFFLLAFRGP